MNTPYPLQASPSCRRGGLLPSNLLAGLCLLAGLAGCGGSASQRLKDEGFMDRNPPGVPADAKLVRHTGPEGGGVLNPDRWFAPDNVTFKPAHAGRVWVVDETNAAVVYSGKLRSGDQLLVQPKDNAIYLNKGSVYHRKLPDEHGFLIYFVTEEPATQPAAAMSNGPTPQQP